MSVERGLRLGVRPCRSKTYGRRLAGETFVEGAQETQTLAEMSLKLTL